MSEVRAVRKLWAPGIARLALRARGDVHGIVVHRIEVSQEDASFSDRPEDVVRFFREHPIGLQATSGDMPYPVLVTREGEVVQTVPLSRVTPHARSYNPTTIGVACIGDFRREAPTTSQREALLAVCAGLLASLGVGPEALHSHDSLHGGSHDPAKICPGPNLSMTQLKDDVARLLAAGAPRLELDW